jgi:hypothetical protein
VNNINTIFKHSYLAKSILTIITSSLLFGCNSPSEETELPVEQNNTIKVYFKSISDHYDNASLYVWNDENCGAYVNKTPNANDWDTGLKPDGKDSKFGVYWSLNVDKTHASQCVNFIPRIGENNDKPLDDFNGRVDLSQTNAEGEVFTQEGVAAVYPELIPTGEIPVNHARVYMNTPDGDTNAFRLHVWNEGSCTNLNGINSAWPGIESSGVSDTYGVYWDIPINGTDNCLNIIPNTRQDGDYQTANLKIEFDKTTAIGNAAFIFKGTDKVYYDPMANKPVNSIELLGASAIFANDKTLLINSKEATKIELYYAKNAGMSFDSKTRKVLGSDNVINSSTLSQSEEWKRAEKNHT